MSLLERIHKIIRERSFIRSVKRAKKGKILVPCKKCIAVQEFDISIPKFKRECSNCSYKKEERITAEPVTKTCDFCGVSSTRHEPETMSYCGLCFYFYGWDY